MWSVHLQPPLAGKLSDKRGSAFTVTLVHHPVHRRFCTHAAMGHHRRGWSQASCSLDLGVQSIQVAEQSNVMALVPHARSRINTLYMVARFLGGAAGSAIGATAWSYHRWTGVCVASNIAMLIAMGVHCIGSYSRAIKTSN